MPDEIGSTPSGNLLLAALPEPERSRFLACSRTVDLSQAEVLNKSGEPIRYAYFPLDSCISLGTRVHDHVEIDVALIGREGMSGIALLLGMDVSAQTLVVRAAGPALRMAAAPFLQSLRGSPSLMRILLRYIHVRMQGLAQNTACTRFHVVEERLARLLLMTQDRVPSSAIQLTHEAMADRLGVRRAGITIAASALQREELITYHRGAITILDRQGLEAAACSCYGADNETYAGIMGGWIDPWARRERTAS